MLKKPRKVCVCIGCGKTFTTDRYTSLGNYCSHQCQVDYWHRQGLKRKEAKKAWKASERRRLAEVKQRQIRLAKEFDRIRLCKECGAVFIAETKITVYCSERCKKRTDNRRREHRLDRCTVRDNSITLQKLYAKFNGVCQCCGKQLTFDVDTNDNYYPTIDHVIPISKGGNHIWQNVQLLCRRCNTLKCDRVEIG